METATQIVDNTSERNMKKHNKLLEEIKLAIETANKAGGNALAEYCRLGMSLITARNTLKKALFSDLVDGEILPTKQINRYIGLVIHKNSKKDYSNGTDKELKIDDRIEEQLKEAEPFKNMVNPNMVKLSACKKMPTDDWNAVMSGDDTPYETKTPRTVTPPEGMTNEEFEDYKKKGTKKLCGELFVADIEIKTLKEKISTLEAQTKKDGYTLKARDKEINDLNEEVSSLKQQINDLKTETEDKAA